MSTAGTNTLRAMQFLERGVAPQDLKRVRGADRHPLRFYDTGVAFSLKFCYNTISIHAERGCAVGGWQVRARQPWGSLGGEKTWQRLSAWCCLAALLALLGLPVVHTWDTPVELVSLAQVTGEASASQSPTLERSETVAHRQVHHPGLCAICQLLAWQRVTCAPPDAGLALPCPPLSWFVPQTTHGWDTSLALAPSRAPPSTIIS